MIGQVGKPPSPLPLCRTVAMAETLITAPSHSSSSSLFFVLRSRRDKGFDRKLRVPCLKYPFPCQISKRSHVRASSMAEDSNGNPRVDDSAAMDNSSFCIIEGPDALQDFSQMQLQEIRDSIRARRDKIFRLMEEVRRLRIQERIKSAEEDRVNEENEMPDFPSFIPFLPSLTPGALKQYYAFYFSIILGIILFGGLLAPILELRLGIGGTSYEDFIRNMHLPFQLSQVDPIVASFSGGAVGVISSLMVVEVNNVKQQEKKRCKYCCGAGYLACARCSGSGALIAIRQLSANTVNLPSKLSSSERCQNCSGSGKVMCPTCLCTGMEMASEHDPRIDPFV